MVTVYIWFPTEAFDFNTPKMQFNPQKTARGSSLRTFARSVGHAAMHISNTDYDLYFSLYPDVQTKELDLLTSPAHAYPSKFSVDYEVDVEEIGGRCDQSIRIDNLDESAMCRALNHLNSKYTQYILTKKNCSSLVLDLLKIGSKDLSPSFFKTSKDTILRIGGVLEVFTFFFEISSPSDPKPGNNRPLHMFSDFKPMKATFALFELLGGSTPQAARNYAEFLKQELG